MREHPLIVVCGCIGAGKSTAVRALSAALGYLGQMENYADNRFLDRFYEDPVRWALASQLYFVIETLSRGGASSDVGGVIQELNVMLVVDVMSGELEARGYLSPEEMNLLRGVARLDRPVEEPDLYLYLDAETDVLRERITARGRPMEQHIEAAYLTSLRRRYSAVLSRVSAPVLTVRTDHVDIRTSTGLADVADTVTRMLSESHAPSPVDAGRL